MNKRDREQYRVGDEVVFTDEFGQKRIGRIVATTIECIPPGYVQITGTYGYYLRQVSTIRHVREGNR
ncbi:MAG TPA: hypothetical protein VKX46_01215 [Ktedonobacteraceae bacterium]|nr:hypothetical protein [Ktedonobacteraceae bacterium]